MFLFLFHKRDQSIIAWEQFFQLGRLVVPNLHGHRVPAL